MIIYRIMKVISQTWWPNAQKLQIQKNQKDLYIGFPILLYVKSDFMNACKLFTLYVQINHSSPIKGLVELLNYFILISETSILVSQWLIFR